MPGPKRKPLADRFWPRVDMSGGPDACWPWTGAVVAAGYGRIARGGESRGVSPFFTHRVAFALDRGIDPADLPSDVVVRHFECNNPPCCNPAHLRAGDTLANNHDARAQGRTWYQNRTQAACADPDCDKPSRAFGLCQTHYNRQYKAKRKARGGQA